jgi:hypothetical protein
MEEEANQLINIKMAYLHIFLGILLIRVEYFSLMDPL